MPYFNGAVAQLGERLNGIQEVVGSIPISSTKSLFTMSFYVYVLKSDLNGTSYVGHTNDPEKRLIEHNSGKSLATRKKGPWELVYIEKYETRSEAAARERYLKTVPGRLELKGKGFL